MRWVLTVVAAAAAALLPHVAAFPAQAEDDLIKSMMSPRYEGIAEQFCSAYIRPTVYAIDTIT
jgi:hypothetical protein